MPGIVSMDQNGAQSVGFALDASQTMQPKVNGDTSRPHDRDLDVNGTATTPWQSPPQSSDVDASQAPPELTHFTDTYVSFGKLVERVAQETTVSLSKLLDEMGELSVSSAPILNGTNGYSTNSTAVQSSTSDEIDKSNKKKRLVLDWAWGERDKHIRLLVLSKWSRNCDDVSKMIDLNAWLTQQMSHYEVAPGWIGQLKLNMELAKLPSPDLHTALRVLSTGTAPWMPDLGYIPTKPPSPQQMLKTVRNLNALLSIRINLHEELPRQMKDWSIASGRVTFRVPSEFELDVSIAHEDPESPFFIVDLRFLFTPKLEILDAWFQEWVEPEANTILARSGLRGIYDWLHGFVLTHKITILAIQADEIAQTSWTNTLRVQQVHRSLTVQYWTEMPGAKSWIEIGVSSGRPKKAKVSWRGPEPPRLSLRWTRQGVPVDNIPITIDWTDLSLETILKAIVALHIGFILETTRTKVLTLCQKQSGASIEVVAPTADPASCRLLLHLGCMPQAMEMMIEPVSGRPCFSPATLLSSYVERQASRLVVDFAASIENFVCNDLRNRVDKEANNAGWAKLHHINIRLDGTSAAVNQKVVAQSFYRCQGWKSKWVLALTVNLNGASWWLVELSHYTFGNGILKAIPLIYNKRCTKTRSLSQKFLRAIETLAYSLFTLAIAASELQATSVPHALRTVRRRGKKRGPADYPTHITPVLFIKAGRLVSESARGSGCWADQILRLYHKGVDKESGCILHAVNGQLPKRQLDFNLIPSRSGDLSFHNDGTFQVRLQTPAGEPFLDKVVERLRRIERLANMVDVAKGHGFDCLHLGLSRIAFRYCGGYKIEIRFPADAPAEVHVSPHNPHRRVAALLRNVLNHRTGSQAFVFFVRILSQTMPLLRAFDAAQSSAPVSAALLSEPEIHTHSLDRYRICYRHPDNRYPMTTFDVRLRARRDRVEWHINDSTDLNTHPRSPVYQKALKRVFKETGDGWRGVHTGFVAELDGVGGAFERLDAFMKNSAPALPAEDEPVSNATALTQQPPGQQPATEVITLD